MSGGGIERKSGRKEVGRYTGSQRRKPGEYRDFKSSRRGEKLDNVRNVVQQCVILKVITVENHGRREGGGSSDPCFPPPPPGPATPRIRLFSDRIVGWTKIILYLLITQHFSS